jgi:hypothetical protein
MTSDQDTKKPSCPAPTSRERSKRKPAGYWTKERCHEEALKYQFKVDFKKGCAPAYQAAQKHGWIDDICGHMTAINLPAFTKGLCKS